MALAMKTPFKSYDRLKNSGMTEEQARGIIEAIEESEEFSFRELATKSDLLLTKSELRQEIGELKAELKADIAQVRTEIAEVRTELKSEIAELRTEVAELRIEFRTEISGLKAGLRSLQTIFISGFFVIIAGMVLSYFHH